jgi:hypothetical protein
VVHGMMVWVVVMIHGVGAVIIVHGMVVQVFVAIYEVVDAGARHHW